MRILIVEDEARIRAFLARAFEAEGFPRRRGRGWQPGPHAGADGPLRPRDPRPAATGARRPRCPARASPSTVGASGADPVGAMRPGDELRGFGSARSTTSPSRSRSTSCWPGRGVQLRRARVADEGNVIRVGRCRSTCPPPGPGRRHRRRPVGPRVPAAALPDAARRPGDQPRAAAVRSVGLRLRSPLERRRRVRARLRRRSGPKRRSRRFAMPGIELRVMPRRAAAPRYRRRAAVGRVRGRELRGDDRLAELGDDPVSLRLDQPDAAYGFASGRCDRR